MQLTINSFRQLFPDEVFPDSSPTFSKIPDISLTDVKFPDISRFPDKRSHCDSLGVATIERHNHATLDRFLSASLYVSKRGAY